MAYAEVDEGIKEKNFFQGAFIASLEILKGIEGSQWIRRTKDGVRGEGRDGQVAWRGWS